MSADPTLWICPSCLAAYEESAEAAPCHPQEPLLPLFPEEDPLVGSVVADRFILLGRLGQGGMSVVYRAFQRSIKRQVAVKVLTMSEDPASNHDEVVRFEREARSAANLRSPYTITLHDFGALDEKHLFIAMELVTGASLQELIAKEAPLSPHRAIEITKQICRSLEEAHTAGLVHRDMKPSNVMIEGDDQVKVLDFGLVKALDVKEVTLTRPNMMMGTPAYMPPELWTNSGEAVSFATDVYAVGAMLYEMLAGQRIFQVSDLLPLMHCHVYETPPLLADLDDHFAPFAKIDPIIQKCLQKRAEDRFESAQTLRQALDSLGALDTAGSFVPQAIPVSEDRAEAGFTQRKSLEADQSIDDTFAPSRAREPTLDDTHMRPQEVEPEPLEDTFKREAPGPMLEEESVEDTDVRAQSLPMPPPKAAPPTEQPASSPVPAEDKAQPSQPASPNQSKERSKKLPVVFGAVAAFALLAISVQKFSGPSKETPPPPAVANTLDTGVVTSPPVLKKTVTKPAVDAGAPVAPRPAPQPKPLKKARFARTKNLGLTSAEADQVTNEFKSKAIACYDRSRISKNLELTLFVYPGDKASTIRIRPSASGRISRCLERAVGGLKKPKLDGAFATMRFTLSRKG